MAEKITVLFNDRKITLMYTMYPFWFSTYRNRFKFTTDFNWVLNKDKNSKLLLVGWFKKQDTDGSHKKQLLELRKKYSKIFLFDDNDGSESHFLDLLPYLDLYYKKQIFKDRDLYNRSFYGKRLFTDFYHKQFGADETPKPEYLPVLTDFNELHKVKLLWNLAFGQYPVSKWKHKAGKFLFNWFGPGIMKWIFSSKKFDEIPNPIIPKCQARFGYKEYRPLIGFQRKLLLEITKDTNQFLSGRIPLKQYNNEIKEVKVILSPYGWGEVCFRDFEAILNGGVLVKPDMSHIETWPDIFVPNETFIPIKWDGTDVIEKVEALLLDQEKIDSIKKEAWEKLKGSYENLDSRIKMLLDDFDSN
jgi:hypothetical protein